MAGQYRLPHYSRLFSVVLFLSALPRPLPQLSRDSFTQLHPTLSTTARIIAQGCEIIQIEQYITTFRDIWQREIAVHQLVTYCGATAIPALTQVLETEPDVGIRQMAATALAYIGGEEAIRVLINSLNIDSDTIVRKTAADALGYLRATSAITTLIATLEQPQEDLQIRQAAAEALGVIGSAVAIIPLMTALSNTNESTNLRNEAAKALVKIGDPAIGSLITVLNANDLQTQYLAVRILTDIQSPQSLKALDRQKHQIAQILDAAEQANLIEKERIPALCLRGRVVERPIICQIDWIQKNWLRCTQRHRSTPQQCNR